MFKVFDKLKKKMGCDEYTDSLRNFAGKSFSNSPTSGKTKVARYHL